jgi:ribosomal protein S18 acetylase RimI-like enzyme
VDEKEVKEDFYHPASTEVLAYFDDKLVCWAGVHQTQQFFEGKEVKLGGYAICTHPQYRRKGIATKASQRVMEYLKQSGVEVGFLSIEVGNIAAIKLHKKNGFILFPRKFSWTNAKGEVKEDKGGMIAPIKSYDLFKYILSGKDSLYVGKGYW